MDMPLRNFNFSSSEETGDYNLPSRFQPIENYEYKYICMLKSKKEFSDLMGNHSPNYLYSTMSDSDMDSPR